MKKESILAVFAGFFVAFAGLSVSCTQSFSKEDNRISLVFPGAGTAGAGDPLLPGVGPETADECGSGKPGKEPFTTVKEEGLDCFYGEEDDQEAEEKVPAAAIERVLEVVDDVERIHLRLTLNPDFVDNV